MSHRGDYINWESYFMLSAGLAAQRSKDPSTQVGSVIVNDDNRIVATGYNGMPQGVPDDIGLWAKGNPEFLANKYPFVVHAEANAITNWYHRDRSQNFRLYVTLFPCNECAKLIVQSGIREVIYASSPPDDKESFIAAKMIFEMAGVKTRKYIGERSVSIKLPK